MSIKVRVFPHCFVCRPQTLNNRPPIIRCPCARRHLSAVVLDNQREQAKPYHYKDRVVILGDSAHSMVPFYGQGLNCGLEDVRVLHILLSDAGVDSTARTLDGQDDPALTGALSRYSETRHEDLVAACELAMDN